MKGSIHALLGENGAGKTTLMRIAFGMLAPDSGSITVRGKPVHYASPADAIAQGIGMVHQQFSLIPAMTVVENVALGGRGTHDLHAIADRIRSQSSRMGMSLNPFMKVANLTSSERQKLEIVKAFVHDARTLILDEPTAVLTPQDIEGLFEQMRTFADDGGSVVLITHKLQDALANADEVTVLRHGRAVLNAPITSVSEELLMTAMLGTTLKTRTSKPPPATGLSRVVRFENVCLHDEHGVETLDNVSFHVNAGEIVGIAALDSAARTLLRTMAGRFEPTSGNVIRPKDIGFVPEDRQNDAIIADFSLSENMALADAGLRSGMINWTDIIRQTSGVIQEYEVRALSPRSTMRDLSGGNQQKFVLGRELKDRPALLVLENPTQGLDVHATETIHERIRQFRSAGSAIVLYSSDLDELAAVSDRVMVVSRKQVFVTEPDKHTIGRMLLETRN